MRAVCLACDTAPRGDHLAAILGSDFGIDVPADELAAIVARLGRDGLILPIDGRLVGLAVRDAVPALPHYTEFPGGHIYLDQSQDTAQSGRQAERLTAVWMSRASPGTLDEAPPGGGWPASPEVFSNPDMVAPVHAMTVEETVALDRGGSLPRVTVSFETYGTLSPRRDNAILVCHSLTHGAHAAGRHSRSAGRSGWWDAAIGPGKMLDTENYFVICSDALAAGASTGPASLDPATGGRTASPSRR